MKMTGTWVHHADLSKKSLERLRIYSRNLPIKKHIPNTLVGMYDTPSSRLTDPILLFSQPFPLYSHDVKQHQMIIQTNWIHDMFILKFKKPILYQSIYMY